MRPELLAPAGSPEALRAAVQNGADAVYLGWGAFNARRGAKNFSDEEFAAALAYCHERGVRVFLTLNTLVTDRELPLALECRFVSFDEESELLVGEIVNVSADERILNADGTIDPARLRPITFDMANSAYLVLGEKVGNAFQDGKKLK